MSDDGEISASMSSMQLEEFRQKWKEELSPHHRVMAAVEERPDDDEAEATRLFLQGIELEKKRKVFEALSAYRKATQLVPDIEFRIYERNKEVAPVAKATAEVASDEQDEVEEIREEAEDDETDLDKVDLVARFQGFLARLGHFCTRTEASRHVIGANTGAHFENLPVELIIMIMRWVVSSHLDLRSLEQLSLVCKGFYLCARDAEIWRLACAKVWGLSLGDLADSPFNSWREMFLLRPQVRFNGCYISKTSYLRYGENSFQDQSYRPIQLVEYYRYLRFFPDNTCLMMTTADEPQICVGRLTNRCTGQNEIISGHYRLSDDTVIAVMKRSRLVAKHQRATHRRRGSVIGMDTDPGTTTFYLELSIVSQARRRFSQLQWKSYSIVSVKNCRETKADFDLTANKYPPLWFSRVKSYHQESDAPL